MIDDDAFDPSGLTALVVDDNHFQRGISLDLLRTMGFGRAIGADGYGEGLEMLHKHKPDVILVEWLRGPDPLAFVRRVRNGEDIPNRAVNIFMLSNRGSAADVELSRKAGVDAYMRKPISLLALKTRVKRVLDNPRAFIVTATYTGPCRRRRQDPNYVGSMRRLDDPQAKADEAKIDLQTHMARARVAALEAVAKDLKPGDAQAARGVFKAVQDLTAVAEEIGDPNLSFGAKEMARYLQAQGATDRLDPEVVRTHVAALHQLVHLPHALSQEREAVAQSLKRMVDKKLRAA